MYRNLLVGLVATTVLLLAGASSSMIDVFEGQIVSASGNRIALALGGVEYDIRVDSDTRITLDGAPATLDGLTPDHFATVAAKRIGDEWVAIRIEARSQASQATTSAY